MIAGAAHLPSYAAADGTRMRPVRGRISASGAACPRPTMHSAAVERSNARGYLLLSWETGNKDMRAGGPNMLVSTRGRYALRVLADLKEHQEDGRIPLKDIARRQDISEKYLESIVKTLVDGGLLNGTRGRGGGYRLSPGAESRSVGDILRLAEGSLAPVACLVPCAEECPRKEVCPTLPLWCRLNGLVEGFLDGLALGDLLSEEAIDDAARHAALR